MAAAPYSVSSCTCTKDVFSSEVKRKTRPGQEYFFNLQIKKPGPMDLALGRQNIRLEDERLPILILLWKAAADEKDRRSYL
jgi:hypothetical protein